MAEIQKKTINIWDGGIKTSGRSSDPIGMDGAQMVKGFDIYKDASKLVPMQSWESFATTAEKAYGIRALGGQSATIYGVGNALSNWYGSAWAGRIKVDVDESFHLSQMPLWLDMSLLPSEFWSGANSDMSDVRVTTNDGVTLVGSQTENVSTGGSTGDMWIESTALNAGTVPTITTLQSETGTGSFVTVDGSNSPSYAYAIPVTLTGQTINYLTANFKRVGTPGDLTVSIYSDSAGDPNALVATLGTITSAEVSTNEQDIAVSFADQALTGSYHLVFSAVTGTDGSNTYRFTSSSSGTTNLKKATDSGLTTWSTHDTTATPNFTLQNYSATAEKHFYIYYGNSTASAVTYGDVGTDYTGGGRKVFDSNNFRWAFNFGDEVLTNRYDVDEAFTSAPPAFTTGRFGKGVKTAGGVIATDQDDEVAFSGNDVTVSFMLKCSAWENVDLLSDASGGWKVSLDTNGKIAFFVNGSSGNSTSTTTAAITLDTWLIVDCVFDSDHDIYVDNVVEAFAQGDGNYDGSISNDTVKINTGNNCEVSHVWGFNNNLSADDVATKYNNFTNASFWSVGAEELFTAIAPQYDGVQLYQKSITSGGWKETLQGDRPVKSLTKYPVNGFIDDTATYFVISSSPENQGFLTMVRTDTFTVLDTSHLVLSVIGENASKIVVQKDRAINNGVYFNHGVATLGQVGDPGSKTIFTSSTIIQSIVPWRDFLAIGGNAINRAFINIWDLASSNPTERVDVGSGNLRIVGNASDTLFCVVDNFLDDAVKSTNKPTFEIKEYIGNGQVRTTHRIDIPATITSYDDNWERAVSGFKLRRNSETLFYAKLPNNTAGTTFDEGFWAVGNNSRGELSLSLQIDTAGFDLPENVFGFAQQVFYIEKDGGIQKLSDSTYSNTSLYRSLKMNEGNTDIGKKLHAVEVVTEPLDAGQTITGYLKTNNDASRIKIFEMTGTSEISYEAGHLFDETNFPEYKEIEFEIESTGGGAPILEFGYQYELLSKTIT